RSQDKRPVQKILIGSVLFAAQSLIYGERLLIKGPLLYIRCSFISRVKCRLPCLPQEISVPADIRRCAERAERISIPAQSDTDICFQVTDRGGQVTVRTEIHRRICFRKRFFHVP